MNYESMSDFEINLEVARWIGVVINDNQDAALKSKPSSVLCNDIISSWEYNFCNNPADMWPIIVENDITVSPSLGAWLHDGKSHGYNNDSYDMGKIYESNDKNPLRAAAIIFLMMQEAK